MARPKKIEKSSGKFSGRLLVQTTDGNENHLHGFITVGQGLTELEVLTEFQKLKPEATVQGLEIKSIKPPKV